MVSFLRYDGLKGNLKPINSWSIEGAKSQIFLTHKTHKQTNIHTHCLVYSVWAGALTNRPCQSSLRHSSEVGTNEK